MTTPQQDRLRPTTTPSYRREEPKSKEYNNMNKLNCLKGRIKTTIKALDDAKNNLLKLDSNSSFTDKYRGLRAIHHAEDDLANLLVMFNIKIPYISINDEIISKLKDEYSSLNCKLVAFEEFSKFKMEEFNR